MAPGANIDLVEGITSSLCRPGTGGEHGGDVARRLGGLAELRRLSGILWRWAASNEQFLDQTYYAPALAANPNVTFLAATGDAGCELRSDLSFDLAPDGGRGRNVALHVTGNTWTSEIRLERRRRRPQQHYPAPSYQQERDGPSPSGRSPTSRPMPTSNTGVSVYDP